MSNAPEEFEQLRKLLKLKRHEQPPPGFFNDFSSRVLDGIERNKAATPAEKLWEGVPWLARFFRVLENNVLAAGGFATAICAVLIGGVVYSEYVDQVPASSLANNDGAMMASMGGSSFSASSSSTGTLLSSTNAVFSSGLPGSPFDNTLGSLSVQPVSFSPSSQ
ncbi:MAG: hypothetical protein JWR69_4383 [Pedosphaera sp.]|nr:hypothetical protein [Pedosphaera sp.]